MHRHGPFLRKHENIFKAGVFLAAVLTFFLQCAPAQAATYNFTQNSWTGGTDSGSIAVHPTNQTSWNKYSSLSNMVVGNNLTLATSTPSLTARTDVTASSTANSEDPAMVIDGNNVAHVVYLSQEYQSGVWNIAYRNSTNWSNRVDVTTYTSGSLISNNQNLSIFVSSTGVVYLAYISNEYNATHFNIAYRNSTNWSNRVDVTTDTTTTLGTNLPSIAVNSSGVVYIAYDSDEHYNNTSNIAYRSSANWATRVDITSEHNYYDLGAFEPSLFIDANNTVHIAYDSDEYNEGGLYNIAYRNSSNWSNRVDVTKDTTTSVGATSPSLYVDSSGVAHIAYTSDEYNSTLNVAYRNSSNWSARTDVTSGTKYTAYPVLFVDSSGVKYISYQSREYNASYYNIAYRNSNNWATRIDVSNNTLGSIYLTSTLGIDSTHKAYFVYFSNEFNSSYYNIAYKNYTTGGYQSSGNVVSSVYNSTNPSDEITGLTWTEDATLPTSTTVTFGLRTGSSTTTLASASYTNFTNATTGCTKVSGVVTCSSSAMPAGFLSPSNNQYFQYQITETSSGSYTPTVSNVGVTYFVNSPPQFNSSYGTNGVNASQDATSTDSSFGKVLITYSVRDPDTNTGSTTPGYITPSFQYNTGSGWNNITSTYLAAGDLNNKAVATSSYSTYTAAWNAQSQIFGQYSTGTQIMVTANDNEISSNTAQATSSLFAIDTNPPTGTLTLNAASSTISYSLSDNNKLQYRISNHSDGSADSLNILSNGWTNPSASSTSGTSTWNFINTNSYPTVYLLGQDSLGNPATITAIAPAYPAKFSVADLSSPGTGQYREIISWQAYSSIAGATFAQYQIYRSTDGINYSPLTTITNASTSYYIDSAVNAGTVYYYKMLVTDTDGDISAYTNVSSIDSGTVNDKTPPVISNIASSTAATTATVSWNTDKFTNSQVAYGLTSNYSAYSILNSTLATSASVTLLNLAPSTLYHFQIISKDASGNTATSSDLTLTTAAAADTQAPTVPTGLNATSSSATAINLTWIPSNDNVGVVGYHIWRNNSQVATTTFATYTDTGLNASTTYSYTVSAFDAAGNESAQSATATATTRAAADFTPPTISNVASSTSATAATITWNTSELATGQIAYGVTSGYNIYSLINSTPATSTSISLSGLFSSTVYHFEVIATDQSGNIATSSDYTFMTTIAPDTQAPTVPSGLAASSTSSSEIGLSWIPSNDNIAVAGYHIWRNTSQVATTTLATFSDTNLTASTTYTYAVSAFDASGNESAQSATATATTLIAPDNLPPAITNINTTNITTTGATIVWTTDKQADSLVEYSISPDTSFSSSTYSSNLTTYHSIILSGLAPNTAYLYRVTSTAQNGLAATEDNTGAGFSFTTLDGPIISEVQTNLNGVNAAITWNTDRASDSYVYFATSSDFSSFETTGDSDLVGTSSDSSIYTHTITLSDLDNGTEYYFYVESTDQNGAATTDNNSGQYYNFTTLDTTPPVISQVSTPVIGPDSAMIIWNTDKLATSQVSYRTASTTVDTQSSLDSTLSISHAVALTGLATSTPYYFSVSSQNKDGYSTTSAESSFATLSDTAEIIYVSAGGGGCGGCQNQPAETTPPVISGIATSSLSAFGVTISFSTDKDALGIVEYGLDATYGSSNAESDFTQNHSITLTGLRMGTEYHFMVKALDKYGNQASSTDETFTTNFLTSDLSGVDVNNLYQYQQEIENQIESILPSIIPPFIGNIQVSNVTENSATIDWQTNLKAYAAIDYATDNAYNQTASTSPYNVETADTSDKVTAHEMLLSNLQPNTKYHFRVEAFTLPQAVNKSADLTFVTKAGDLQPYIAEVTLNSFRVDWGTPDPADGILEYKNVATGEIIRKVDESQKTFHEFTVNGLPSNTQYAISVSSTGPNGNIMESKNATYVTTGKDIIPPVIANLKIDNTLVPGSTDEAQTLVSWSTDKPATSVVYYQQGAGVADGAKTLTNKAQTDGDYVTDHVVIISSLQSGDIYQIQIQSTDAAGNSSESAVKTIVVPRQEQSVSDIIFKNFEDSFKFLQSGH